jgi:hypothetical protein
MLDDVIRGLLRRMLSRARGPKGTSDASRAIDSSSAVRNDTNG